MSRCTPFSQRLLAALPALWLAVPAIGKLWDLGGFVMLLISEHRFAVPFAWLVGSYLPWLEMSLAGALLFAPGYRRAAAYLGCGLLTIFTGWLLLAAFRAEDSARPFVCPCFGVHSPTLPLSLHLVLNIVAMATLVFYLRAAHLPSYEAADATGRNQT
jgi:hypothetical protein